VVGVLSLGVEYRGGGKGTNFSKSKQAACDNPGSVDDPLQLSSARFFPNADGRQMDAEKDSRIDGNLQVTLSPFERVGTRSETTDPALFLMSSAEIISLDPSILLIEVS
jgi:hypothetical protein